MKKENSSIWSALQSSEKFNAVMGFDYNHPYLTPRKIENKIGKDFGSLGFDLADHVTAIRRLHSKTLSFNKQTDQKFWFCQTNQMEELLHKLDKNCSGDLAFAFGGDLEKKLFSDFLFDEAFSSARLGGSSINYRRASEIIYEGYSPETEEEQKLQNVLHTLEYIFKEKQKPLTIDKVFELQSILSSGDKRSKSGQSTLRNSNTLQKTDVYSVEYSYKPPSYKHVQSLLQDLMTWLYNDKPFIHPIIKSTVLYFYLLYLHPFKSDNGKFARTAFYYFLYENGYDFVKFLSISSVIDQDKSMYSTAFSEVEENTGDLSYFIVYILESIYNAYSKIKEKSSGESNWIKVQQKMAQSKKPVNDRQLKLIKGFSYKRYEELTTEAVEKMNKVKTETARKDLNELVDWKMISKKKKGKQFVYTLTQ